MKDSHTDNLLSMLGQRLDHMEGADEVASGIARECPEYAATAETVRSVAEMVSMACELEAYDAGCESRD